MFQNHVQLIRRRTIKRVQNRDTIQVERWDKKKRKMSICVFCHDPNGAVSVIRLNHESSSHEEQCLTAQSSTLTQPEGSSWSL